MARCRELSAEVTDAQFDDAFARNVRSIYRLSRPETLLSRPKSLLSGPETLLSRSKSLLSRPETLLPPRYT